MTYFNLPINFSWFFFFINFFIYIKITQNLLAKYYQENKERLLKKACERYQDLPKEEEEKKWQYGHKRYKNPTEDVEK